MWTGKSVIGKKNLYHHSNSFLKLLYKRIIPIAIVAVMINYSVCPVLDILFPDKYMCETIGVLNGISTNANKPIAEFSIRIDKKTYRVPKSLISHNNLKKEKRYKIYYYQNSRLVYDIMQVR